MQLLAPEDEQQLGTSLNEKIQQDDTLNRQISQKNQAISWIEGIARLEEELKQLDQQKDDWQIRIAAFAPDQARLEAANRALEFAGEHAALTAIRQEQERDRRTLGECQESLPDHEEAAKLAEGIMQATAKQLAAKKKRSSKRRCRSFARYESWI
jgi:exonuclease SbcC